MGNADLADEIPRLINTCGYDDNRNPTEKYLDQDLSQW